MKPRERRQKFDEIIRDIATARGLENFLAHVGKILRTIPSSLTNQDLLNVKLKEYETVGNFARHYSATRSAVLTFLVGLSFGITGFFIKKTENLTLEGLADALHFGYWLALFTLFIACVFDLFLYEYLKTTLSRGIKLEEEINKEFRLTKDVSLKFYQRSRSTIFGRDGPTICLWAVTLVFIILGILLFLKEGDFIMSNWNSLQFVGGITFLAYTIISAGHWAKAFLWEKESNILTGAKKEKAKGYRKSSEKIFWWSTLLGLITIVLIALPIYISSLTVLCGYVLIGPFVGIIGMGLTYIIRGPCVSVD